MVYTPEPVDALDKEIAQAIPVCDVCLHEEERFWSALWWVWALFRVSLLMIVLEEGLWQRVDVPGYDFCA